jgi:hypothetical protein
LIYTVDVDVDDDQAGVEEGKVILDLNDVEAGFDRRWADRLKGWRTGDVFREGTGLAVAVAVEGRVGLLVPIMDAAIRVWKFARANSDGAAAGEDKAEVHVVRGAVHDSVVAGHAPGGGNRQTLSGNDAIDREGHRETSSVTVIVPIASDQEDCRESHCAGDPKDHSPSR